MRKWSDSSMPLLEEYKIQNTWRDWGRYLDKLPLESDQTVYDLGCSIGFVTKMLAQRVKKTVGIDNDEQLLEEANKNKPDNCAFMSENVFTCNPSQFKKCDGIWTSFSLAYMSEPEMFIENWMKCLNDGGWFAVADIDGLFSSHLSGDSKYYERIEQFENQSELSKIYDFTIGRKIKSLMQQSGLRLIVEEDDWYDRELNFNGKAAPDIIQSWSARLERMVSLKLAFGATYSDFTRDFLGIISQDAHITNGGVRYYAGIK